MADVQLEIDEHLVRALLRDQHPDLADRTVVLLSQGWDNRIFRLGDDLVVRLPRRAASAELVLHEQRWLPELLVRAELCAVGLATPRPVRSGAPGAGYPWPWIVGPWLPGDTAHATPPSDSGDAARRLGAFLAAFHHPAPAEAPVNPHRGIPLAGRQERLERQLTTLAARPTPRTDPAQIRRRWDSLVGTPPWDGPPQWIHGDLHPRNLLVHHGRLSAVLDFGDLTSGDPATDLAVAWHLFPPAARRTFLAATGHDANTIARSQAWALVLGLAYQDSTDALMAEIGRRTVDAVLADDLP